MVLSHSLLCVFNVLTRGTSTNLHLLVGGFLCLNVKVLCILSNN